MEKLFEIVNELALKEIELYGGPSLCHYYLALEKGEQIAKALNTDVEIVKIGLALMDIKLGQCIKEKCQSEHVQKGYLYAKQILEQNKVDEKLKEKLLDCVLSHHGTKNKSLQMWIVIDLFIRKACSHIFKRLQIGDTHKTMQLILC